MFPTHGLFYSVNCPDFIEGTCVRPYCHFFHDVKLKQAKKVICRANAVVNNEISRPTHEIDHGSKNLPNEYSESYVPVQKKHILHHESSSITRPSSSTQISYTGTGIPKRGLSKELQHQSNEERFSKSNSHLSQQCASTSSNEESVGLKVTNALTNEKGSSDDSDILQQLISEAVKKVLSENSKFNTAAIDPGSLIKKLDTNSLVTKAVNEITGNVSPKSKASERWQSRLYLPPPGIPSYLPTPINELKRTKSIELSESPINEEYTPTPITSVTQNDELDEETTDFSEDGEDNGNEVRSEFDMLEEVLVEQTVDAARKKVILKRKRALGKLASAAVSTNSGVLKNKSTVGKVLSSRPSLSNKEYAHTRGMDESDAFSDDSTSFRPPSPIFRSSSASNIPIPTEFRRNSNCDLDLKIEVTEEPSQSPVEENRAISNQVSNFTEDISPSSSEVPSHNMLPQIAELSRPNLKSWTPVAKVDSLLSVEKMLEQLDRVTTDVKSSIENNLKPLLSSNNRTKEVSESHTFSRDPSDMPTVCQNKDIDEEQSVHDEVVSMEDEIENQEKEPSEKTEKEGESDSKKRTYASDESYERERKRIKYKKSHRSSRKKQKKHKKNDSSTSDSFSESDDDSLSEYYDSDSDRERKRSKKSKRKKHRRKSSHHRKSKHRHKKSKASKSRKKRRRSRNSQEKHSSSENSEEMPCSSNNGDNSDNTSKPVAVKVPELLCQADIKKEKFDIPVDISIVKTENVNTRVVDKVNALSSIPDSISTRESPTKITSADNTVSGSGERKPPAHLLKEKSSSVEEKVDNVLQIKSAKAVKSSPANENRNLKDCSLNSDSVQKISMFDRIAANLGENSKPKTLTEFSIFDSLPSDSPKKVNKRRQSNSENLAINKQKCDPQKIVKKGLVTEATSDDVRDKIVKNALVTEVTGTSDDVRDKSSSKKETKLDVQSSHKSSSHSSYRSKDKERKNSSAENKQKNDSKDSNKSERHRRRSSREPDGNNGKGSKASDKLHRKNDSKESDRSRECNRLTDTEKTPRQLQHSEKSTQGIDRQRDKKHKEPEKHGNKRAGTQEPDGHRDKNTKEPHKNSERSAKESDRFSHKSSNESDKHRHKVSKENKDSKESDRHRHKSSKESDRVRHKSSKESESHKEKSSKGSERNRDKYRSHSHKSKSESKCDSKQSRSSSSTSDDHHKKSRKSDLDAIKTVDDAKNNGRKVDRLPKEIQTVKSPLASEVEEMFTGCESPFPDLSALDDLPKEDWDQLLSNSNDKMENSDTDEGIDFDADPFDVGFDNDDAENPEVLEECMKVFSEYKPDQSVQSTVRKKDPPKSIDVDTSDVPTRKPRVAHCGASGNLIPKSKPLIKPVRKTPAQVMLERYEKLKAEELVLQKKLELQRQQLEKHGKLVSSSGHSAPALSSSSVSSTSDPAVSSTTGMPRKRVARAPSNVSAMLKSKAALKAVKSAIPAKTKPSPAQPEPRTFMGSNSKGSKRIAHTPKLETLERPIVSMEEGTKLPQNIRQRYLNCFIDETLKFCDGEEHAFEVAVAEESICHKRAPGRMVYLNLAVNVLKKLRTGVISEAAQELMESDTKYKCAQSKSFTSPDAVSSASVPKKAFEHPINPNHRTVSHFSVMAQGGQKGSWSILKPKKSLPNNINDYMTGKKFYESIEKYIMSIEQLEENCFPRPDPKTKGRAILKKINTRKKISPNEIQRYCDRCSILYEVDQWGLPVISVSCVYHWGRAYKRRGYGGLETRYSCCSGDTESEGCCLGTTHVSENFSPDNLKGFVRTIPKEPDADGCYGVFALDCEMCYTTGGSELTRITVSDTSNNPVYETLVKPDNPIIDYNTRFSGITEGDLDGVNVTLRDVQASLLTRFSEKTILMGHSLESDFSALKLIHDTVVDTSVVFPHKLGAPYKRALRNLASEYLSKIIQNDSGGHDSAEDSITCMQLMQWRVKEDLKEKRVAPT